MEDFKSIDDILDFAIASEQEAIDFYTSLTEQAKNEAMRKAFLQFAREETGHKERLIRIKENQTFEFTEANITDLKIGDYIVDVTPSADMSYKDALIVAMKKEKAAFKLYSDLAERAPNDDLRDMFLSLAQEEAKHKLRFEIEYDDNVFLEN